MNKVLGDMSFVKCSKEASLYRKREKEHLLLVAVYVYVLLITGSNVNMIHEFKQGMSAQFDMSDLRLLTYYLGIEVCQSGGGITLVQERYTRKILEESGMIECNAVTIPMDSGLKISMTRDEEPFDEKEYRRQIGCLRYLIHTRPDLSYVVGVLIRYMHEPKVSHAAALKQVFGI